MRLPLIGTIVLTILTAETVHAQKYTVRFSSPDHVGQKTHISLIGSWNQDSASTLNGSVIKSVSINKLVVLEGREEILALDASGSAFRQSFTVEKFTSLENGVTSILLNPGIVILSDGSREGANRVVLKNGVMTETARETFLWLMAPHKPDSHTDDDIFGTSEPKAIGDSWTINKLAAISDWGDLLVIPIERMTGVITLVSKGNFGGDDCLNMLAEVKSDGVALRKSPEGFVPNKGTMSTTLRTCVPINPAVNSRKVGMVMNSQFRLKGTPGTLAESVIVETTLNQRVEATLLPVR